MVHCAAYDCVMIVGRPKAFPSTNFKQITKEGKLAVTTNDFVVKDHSKLHHAKLRSDALPTTT